MVSVDTELDVDIVIEEGSDVSLNVDFADGNTNEIFFRKIKSQVQYRIQKRFVMIRSLIPAAQINVIENCEFLEELRKVVFRQLKFLS